MHQPEPDPGTGRPTSGGIEDRPDPARPRRAGDDQVFLADAPFVNVHAEAAHALVETLFAGARAHIPNVRYAVTYRLAEGRSGGDIIDVFHYNNDNVSVSIADIAGKGQQAAIHASLIKYGLRALASSGQTAENVVRALDRLYLENNAFERTPDSFATLFFGIIDASRRFMQYTNAGHEPVMLIDPDGTVRLLPPTAPLVGVFEDQHHLFTQRLEMLPEGTVLVATTDGVSEARGRDNALFGVGRIGEIAAARRHASEREIGEAILDEATAFGEAARRDDIAILVCRFV